MEPTAKDIYLASRNIATQPSEIYDRKFRALVFVVNAGVTRLTRFVCPALRFIPHEPREKKKLIISPYSK